jgi:hypothetical protein
MDEFEGKLDSIVCDIMFESKRSDFTSEEGVKMIVDFLKDAGWRSPQEVMDTDVIRPVFQPCHHPQGICEDCQAEFMIGFEAWAREKRKKKEDK